MTGVADPEFWGLGTLSEMLLSNPFFTAIAAYP